MKNYTIDIINKSVAKKLIIENHYSHSWTSCKYSIGLFDNDLSENTYFNAPELVGVAILGFPVGRQVVKSITDDLKNSDVLELTRLWLRDEEPKNSESYFLGRIFNWLRKNTNVKVLISYSDPAQNHLGLIYQATNWLYQGNNTMLVKSFIHNVNGKFLHPRTTVAKYGTIKTEELLKIDKNYKRIELKKKHRYLYILHKKDRNIIISKLKHKILPYPKDNFNSNW